MMKNDENFAYNLKDIYFPDQVLKSLLAANILLDIDVIYNYWLVYF